jgi:hypothetical protein
LSPDNQIAPDRRHYLFEFRWHVSHRIQACRI